MLDKELTIKCVLVGDGAVGKTSLLVTYAKGTFPESYVPTVFDNYTTKISIKIDEENSTVVTLCLFDTAGQEDYVKLRELSYPSTNIFAMIFSVVAPSSFENIKAKWYPEIKQHLGRDTILILVGTQSDLRDAKVKGPNRVVTREMGERIARELKCALYMETSAYLKINVSETFTEGVVNYLNLLMKKIQQSSKQKCDIL